MNSLLELIKEIRLYCKRERIHRNRTEDKAHHTFKYTDNSQTMLNQYIFQLWVENVMDFMIMIN